MPDFKPGEYIIYQNGERFELGKIKRVTDDGAFVYYHEGDTAAKTPFDCMQKLINAYTIKADSLGGEDPGKPPVWKNGETVFHVSRADGTGGFEKNKWAEWTCPACGWFVGEQYIPRHHNQQKSNFCSRCGQRIDWANAKSPIQEGIE